MVYIGIIVTLILVVRVLEFGIRMIVTAADIKENIVRRNKQDQINEEMVELHKRILEVLEDKQ